MNQPYPGHVDRHSVAIDKEHADSDNHFMPSVAILALPNCLMSGVVGPLEIFAIANSLVEGEPPVFDPVEVVGVEAGQTTGFSGLVLPVKKRMTETEPDIVVIPPVFAQLDDLLEDGRITTWLKQRHDAGAIITTACAGSFFLAETGILDGKTATTHWKLVDRFVARYPDVDLQPKMMIIDGGHFICAGGAMAWQDLALHLVARFMDPGVASDCAKLLVMDGTRHVQTPYFMFQDTQQKDFTDPGIDAVRSWLQQHYAEPFELDALARMAEMGTRTFLRRFKRATGQTPLNYLKQLRIEAARHLLEVSTKNIEEITGLTGYSDSSSFRRLFKEKTGLTPKEYRARFHRLS